MNAFLVDFVCADTGDTTKRTAIADASFFMGFSQGMARLN
jgi:hypothetical protein